MGLQRSAGRPSEGGTLEEIRFLKRLGEFYVGRRRDNDDKTWRLRGLLGYRAAMENRVDWGRIDRLSILAVVEALIAKEQKKVENHAH